MVFLLMLPHANITGIILRPSALRRKKRGNTINRFAAGRENIGENVALVEV